MRPIDFYKEYFHLQDPALLKELVTASRIRSLRTGEHIITPGTVPTHLCFLLHGVVRGFMLNANGKDLTDCFVYACGQTVMPESDLTIPATITLEVLEDSEIIMLPLEKIYQLLRKYPYLTKIYEQLLLVSTQLHREQKIALCQYTALQRYQWFLKAYPGLIDRIPHKYIASFLNMTPVTLSNVRRTLRQHQS